MGVPFNLLPPPPTPSSPCFCEKKSAWTKENGMNRCFAVMSYICSQARSSQRRRCKVALPKLRIL